jgi:hypothetical protein
MTCLYWSCKNNAMDCDTYCAFHRSEYGLYLPMTYAQAYAKAKARYEATGEKHFVYRHKHIGRLHKGYGTSRVTKRNWIHAIFSEVIFPRDESLVSTHTAQEMLFALLGGQS